MGCGWIENGKWYMIKQSSNAPARVIFPYTVGSNALTVGSNALTVGSNALTVGSNALTVGTNALTVGSNALKRLVATH